MLYHLYIVIGFPALKGSCPSAARSQFTQFFCSQLLHVILNVSIWNKLYQPTKPSHVDQDIIELGKKEKNINAAYFICIKCLQMDFLWIQAAMMKS